MSTRLVIDGYGQVELNNAAFRRDGRIEAQCAPDTTDFSQIPVENGMLLGVDAVARKVALCDDASLPIALVYSAEHYYEDRYAGLKNFKLNGSDDFLPRLGYLSVGDKFTSNCLCYGSEFADETAFMSACESYASTTLYGGISDIGAIAVSTTAPTQGPVLKVAEKTTMPDGTFGLKFHVVAD